MFWTFQCTIELKKLLTTKKLRQFFQKKIESSLLMTNHYKHQPSEPSSQPPQPTSRLQPQSPRQPTSNFWFVLGREPLMSVAEICAVLSSPCNIKYVTSSIPTNNIFSINANIQPNELINRLG